MAKPEPDYCTYAVVKLDDQIVPLAKAAASIVGKKFQDWLSDLANEAAAKVLRLKPIVRRKPKPREPKPPR